MNETMSFGRNPHVAKAEAAEQKAGDATDNHSRARAWREAAHLWERAAERETDVRRGAQYVARAEAARAKADAPPDESQDARAQALREVVAKLGNPRTWN
jgi:hypothetical protein